MKHYLIAGAIFAAFGFAGSAIAADMPVKAPIYKAPPPAVAISWTGCYVGANVGGGRSPVDITDPASGLPDADLRGTGVVGGGQIGCDYQMGSWVFGAQGMFDLSGMQDKQNDPIFIGFADELKSRWFGTATARLGYTVLPAVLIYAKGGAAWIRYDYTNYFLGVVDGVADVTRPGWTAGGGVEWMFAPQWSVFAEYDHMDFGSNSTTYSRPGGGSFRQITNKQEVDVGLIGINFRFNRF